MHKPRRIVLAAWCHTGASRRRLEGASLAHAQRATQMSCTSLALLSLSTHMSHNLAERGCVEGSAPWRLHSRPGRSSVRRVGTDEQMASWCALTTVRATIGQSIAPGISGGIVAVFVTALLAASSLASPQSAPTYGEFDSPLIQQVQALPVDGGIFVTEDGIDGFAVMGAMAQAFQSRGGHPVWGQPISRSWQDDSGRENQAFEKGIFQISSDGQGGYSLEFANVFDELSRAGKDTWLDDVRQTPRPFDWSSDESKSWDEIVDNHLSMLAPYPQLREYVLAQPDWLDMFGLPISVKDYVAWVSLRMQRSNLQLYVENVAWAQAGEILVANGGTVAKEAGGLIPETALLGQKLHRADSTVKSCSPWPADIDPLLRHLPLPEGVCLLRATEPPPREPGCIVACYVWAERAVWYNRAASRVSEKVDLGHELCHAHQQLIVYSSGFARPEQWHDTQQAREFVQAYDQFDAYNRTRGRTATWSTLPHFENFANMCAGWYLQDPRLDDTPNFPYIRDFFRNWLPK